MGLKLSISQYYISVHPSTVMQINTYKNAYIILSKFVTPKFGLSSPLRHSQPELHPMPPQTS